MACAPMLGGGGVDLGDLPGATARCIVTILNARRASATMTYDTDRAILRVLNRVRMEALLGPG